MPLPAEREADLTIGRPADAVREQRDELAALRSKHDDLQTQFTAQSPTSNIESDDLLIDLAPHSRHSFDESAARNALMGSRQSPDTLRRSNKTVRFRDSLVDTEEMENQQVLQLHERVMEEQDESLDRLSQSIHSQRELSIQIGDELDDHVRLLDGVDELVDRHQSRLEGAKKRLNHIARTAKDHGMLCILFPLV
jgi:syntaxin 8